MKTVRIFTLLLVLCLIAGAAWASDEQSRNLDKKLSRLERYIYGEDLNGATADRPEQPAIFFGGILAATGYSDAGEHCRARSVRRDQIGVRYGVDRDFCRRVDATV